MEKHETPQADGCMDCGRPYPHGLDMILTKAQWLRINPADGGVLCPSCIVNRAEKLPAAISVYAHIICGEHYDSKDSLEHTLIASRMETSNYSRENAELKHENALLRTKLETARETAFLEAEKVISGDVVSQWEALQAIRELAAGGKGE